MVCLVKQRFFNIFKLDCIAIRKVVSSNCFNSCIQPRTVVSLFLLGVIPNDPFLAWPINPFFLKEHDDSLFPEM